jgi:hypothetical protein
MPMEQQQGFADVVADGLLDGERNPAGLRRLLLAAHQLANHLVDGRRVRDRAAAVDSHGNLLRILGVDGVVALDEEDLPADLFRLAHQRAGLDAEGLGLVAGGDADRGVGVGGDDGQRAIAIFRVQLLLDRREEAVQVDVEEAEAVGFITPAIKLAGDPGLERIWHGIGWLDGAPSLPFSARSSKQRT